MDLSRALSEHDISRAEERANLSDLPIIMVAPSPAELPDDGFLKYSVASDVKSLLAPENGAVFLFREEDVRVLEMLIEYQHEFGVQIKVLVGLPNVSYDPWFDTKVWSQEDVSYSGLLSELSVLEAEKHRMSEGSRTVNEKEESQFTRNDGSVRDNTNFSLQSEIDDAAEEDD